MRKLKYILLLLIAISCTKEVEVLNPINAENVKKIAELQSQLSSLTSSLSGLQSQNQNLTNERNNLVEQLSSLQSQLSTLEDTNTSLESQITALEETNTSLESQIEFLKIKVAELGLAVAINIGVQDGVYTLKEWSFKYIKDENDTIPADIRFPETTTYSIIKDKKQIKRTVDELVDIYDDSSNKLNFKKWVLEYGMRNAKVQPDFRDSIYVSNVDEITSEFSYNGGTFQFEDGLSYDNVIIKHINVWQKHNSFNSEEDVPAQGFLEINKFIRENSTVGTFSDSIYKNIDPFDPISLREGFILDAQRNGLDISYLRDEEITLETVDWNYGIAYGSPCRTGVIKIYREDSWEPIIKPLQNSVLFVMFHEMGHAALNLAHNKVDGDIMCCASDLSLDNFREISKRMFQNIEQISYDCGFATQKGGGTIIVD
jgi:cell division protein FtsB